MESQVNEGLQLGKLDVLICVIFVFRFSPVSENAPVGQAVGMVLAAAANTTVFYTIVGGNEGGECPENSKSEYETALSATHCLFGLLQKCVNN